MKKIIKGNDAIIYGALLAGCDSYYGYPITPASEIAHQAAYLFPQFGRTFLQAESEVGAINMVYGASACGERVMTASSSPGISLKQEGISYIAGSDLPCVIIDIVRGGPGLGNIAPEQGDYNQVIKGGGHGNYKVIVLAPNCVQEMCEFTMKAFVLADKYRMPAFVLADGIIGQMMEPLQFPEPLTERVEKKWAVTLEEDQRNNIVTSIEIDPNKLENMQIERSKRYEEAQEKEPIFEEKYIEDAEIVLIGYGIVSRILSSAVSQLQEEGIKVGLFRPHTLWPFPKKQIDELTGKIKRFLVVEMSDGQLVDDIRLIVNGRIPVEFYGRTGGVVPTINEIKEKVKKIL